MSLLFVIEVRRRPVRFIEDDRPVIVGPFPDADGPEIVERLGNLRGAVNEANSRPEGFSGDWVAPWGRPVVRPVTDDVLDAYEALVRFRDEAEEASRGEGEG